MPATKLNDASDFVNWDDDVRRFAREQDLNSYLLPDEVEITHIEDPYYTRQKPVIPVRTTENYLEAVQDYRLQLDNYNTERKAAIQLNHYMLEALTTSFRHTIRDQQSPAEIYHAVRRTYKANKKLTQRLLEAEYVKTRQNSGSWPIEQWLAKLLDLHVKGTEHEAMYVTYMCQWFLDDVEKLSPVFKAAYTFRVENDELTFPQLVVAFRQHLAIRGSSQLAQKGMTGTFTTATQHSTAATTTTSKKSLKSCVCGEKEPWRDCPYLNTTKRSKTWTAKPEVVQKIKNQLIQQKWLAELIKSKIGHSIPSELYIPQSERMSTQQSETTLPQQNVATNVQNIDQFAATVHVDVVVNSTHSTHVLPYRDWWIVDSGSPIHITNSAEYFTEYRSFDANEQYLIRHGANGSSTTVGSGTVPLVINTPSGSSTTILLPNVVYVPGFITNIISTTLLKQNHGIYYSNHVNVLFNKKGRHLIQLYEEYNQTIVAKAVNTALCRPIQHTVGATAVRQTQPIQPATTELWHKRLGHPGHDIVNQLPTSTDVVLTTKPTTSTDICETCVQAKSKATVSRVTMPRGNAPFNVVHFDYVHMPVGFNGTRYLLHFYDPFSHWHIVNPIATRNASVLQPIIQGVILWIQKRGFDVHTVHSDSDPSLAGLETWLQHHGITFQQSTPYNHEQNGFAERAGGVLVSITRALRIYAGLPESMWPVLAQTAAYLYNRWPIRSLGWQTPYFMLYQKRPSLANVRIAGCKAYVLRKQTAMIPKLDTRVWIGYLVGFVAHNIWKVWNPATGKTHNIRDVTFDENVLYDSTRADLLQPLKTAAVEEAIVSYEIDDVDQQSLEHPVDTYLPTLLEQRQKSKDQIQQQPRQLPTPSETTVTDDDDDDSDNGISIEEPTTTVATRSQLANPDDVSEDNILSTRRQHKPSAKALGNAIVDADDILHYVGVLHTYIDAQDRDNVTKSEELTFVPYATKHTIATIHSTQVDQTSATEQTRTRIHQTELPPPPKTWLSMTKHPHSDGFTRAAHVEYDTINTRGTWLPTTTANVPTAYRKHVLPLKWVFTYKFDNEGYLVKYKARIVVCGNMQAHYVSKADVYANTLAMKHFRTLMALTAAKGLVAKAYDAVNAYLHAWLNNDEVVYVWYPPGFTRGGHVLQLKRPLYGLRTAPRSWFDTCCSRLRQLGYKQVGEEPCLWIHPTKLVYIFFYVDDFITAGDEDGIEQARHDLTTTFEMRELGIVSYFLGVKIDYDKSKQTITLSQNAYIDKLVKLYNIERPKRHPRTPIRLLPDMLDAYNGTASQQQILLMQRLIGSLLYLTMNTRPETAAAVCILAQHMLNPSPNHITAAKQIIEYVDQNRYGIKYSRSTESLTVSSDASYANAPGRRSIQGMLFMLNGGPVQWQTKKQSTVATSTTEAELIALSATVRELLGYYRFITQLRYATTDTIPVLCDNKQTVDLVNSRVPYIATKLRHVDIQQHWLREYTQSKTSPFTIKWIPTDDMPADGFTKLLTHTKHDMFIKQLHLVKTYH